MVTGTVADVQDAPGLDVGYDSLDLVADLVDGRIVGLTVEGWRGRSTISLRTIRVPPLRHDALLPEAIQIPHLNRLRNKPSPHPATRTSLKFLKHSYELASLSADKLLKRG